MGLSAMTPPPPRAVPRPLPGSLLAWLASRLDAVLPAGNPVATLRLALYLGGVACFGGVQLLAPYVRPGLVRHGAILAIVALLFCGLALFTLCCCSAMPGPLRALAPHGRRLAILGFALILPLAVHGAGQLAAVPAGLAQPRHYQNDAVTITSCATDLFLRGRDPYADFSVVDCFTRHGLTGRYTTPLRAGAFAGVAIYPSRPQLEAAFARARAARQQHPREFESYFSYPAGAFLLTAPFVALGWRDLSSFYLVCLLGCYALLAWWSPRRWRPWLLPIALANIALWDQVVSGSSDALDLFLILAAWTTWRRPWLSALLMGAALAARQQSWFFAVFWIVLVVRARGPRAALRQVAVMAAVFGLLNLPFVLHSPQAWFHGVLGPLLDPMFPLGAGLIGLVVHGWLPLGPRGLYSALQLAALGACVLWYARACRRHPGAGLALALVPLAFGWRSLLTYFVALPIYCLWPLLHDLRASPLAAGDG